MKPTSISFCTLLAALLAATSLAHAQYSTNFDSYSSPLTTPTDPLPPQDSWTTNDTLNSATTGTAQVVGQSNFVGNLPGYFSGQGAALGGVYRTPAGSATAAAPDVVPSTATAGIATLARPFTLAAGNYNFQVDFAVTSSSTAFPANDSFAWTFGTATGKSFSINFTPNGVGQDQIGYTLGNNAPVTTVNAVVLNAQYHLLVNVTVGASPSFTATISSGTNSVNFTSSLTGVPVAPGSIDRVAATWTLANTSGTTNGGYQNAGSNALLFDNYAIATGLAVPEPSTYALMILGGFGLIGMLRLRRTRA